MHTEPPAESPEYRREGSAPRQFPRYPFQLPFLYRVHRLQANTFPRVGVGWTRTLSEGGAGVELGELLAPGWSLALRVQTAQGPLDLLSQVVWSEIPREAGRGFLHGLVCTAADAKWLHALREIFQVLNVFRTLSGTQRAGIRLPLGIPAVWQAMYPPGPLLPGQTGNVSREGLLLLLPEVLAPGTVLGVTLESPHGPVPLEGVVVWREASARAALEDFVRHGVQLTTRDWATALALGHLVVEIANAPVPPRKPGGRPRTGVVE